MRHHYSQASRENATPSSGTSPLAFYKEVPPPPGCLGVFGCRLLAWSKWETTCRFLPALSEVLKADLGQRTKDIWTLRDISISSLNPLRKGGENLGFSWNSTLWTINLFLVTIPCLILPCLSLPALQTVTNEDELVTCTQYGGFGRARKQAKVGECCELPREGIWSCDEELHRELLSSLTTNCT